MAAEPPNLEELLARNRKYAVTYVPTHMVENFAEGKVKFPSVIIISCCDPRIIPEEFGLFSREEYVVVRNAGGRAEPALRDVVVLQTLAEIKDVVVVHHVDCGLTHLTNASIRKALYDGNLGDEKLDTLDFGEIRDLKKSVIEDIAYLRGSPYIKKDIRVHGYVFKLLTDGTLVDVEEEVIT